MGDFMDRMEAAKREAAKQAGETYVVGEHLPDPYVKAAEWKRAGMGRMVSWSRWVQATNLSPGMDAKDWYRIWDSV